MENFSDRHEPFSIDILFFMLFSIITVTYNAEKYLAETLKSVASQTFKDYEHLIWDGGSTDTTLEIARSFPSVKIYQGKDEGISDAMNKGTSYAQGKFILHLHADDFLAHESVLEMVAICLKQHPYLKWIYGKAAIVDLEGKLLRLTPHEPYSSKRLRKYNFITHPSTFIDREFFQTIGGFEKKLRYVMDYDLWLRCSLYSAPLALPSILACFREHSQSLSTSEPFQVAEEAYRVRNSFVKNFLERYRSYLTYKRRIKKLNKFD